MKLKWGDLIVFAVIAVIIAAMFFLGVTSGENETLYAEISLDGNIIHTISLDENNEILFHDGDVRIIVEDNKIRFIQSDCSDLVCVNTGWIKNKGRIAACLPNRILVKIIGFSDEVDVVLH